MLIDWFTVGAQALNFIVLVWLMKRLLYKPILDAIDAREQRIASELAEAGSKKTQAQQEGEAFQKKNEAFDQQRAALLKQAGDDANAERKRLMDAACQAAEALATQRQEALASEALSLTQAVRQHAQAEVLAIARQALSDLAGVELEASACEVFIDRLRCLDGEAKDALVAALRGAKGKALLRSAFELPGAQRRAVHQAIADSLDVKLELQYETAPDLVSGIELVAGGEKFAWSIGDYLATLERSMSEVLTARSLPPAGAAAGAAPATP